MVPGQSLPRTGAGGKVGRAEYGFRKSAPSQWTGTAAKPNYRNVAISSSGFFVIAGTRASSAG